MTNLEVIKNKIFTKETLKSRLAQWKFFKKKIVFTNGCFDILHQGHIDYLSKAADCGDILIVGINTDNSVKRLGKGNSRPVQDENSRAIIVAALHFVSAVILFDEGTPLELIKFIEPAILVKGADYDGSEKNVSSPKYIVGSAEVKAGGGEVKTIELLDGFSTSSIEKKIKNG